MIAWMIAAMVTWHSVPLANMTTTTWTHVCTTGPVVYVRKMADGDYHVTLRYRDVVVVAEIIPQLPLEPPKKGQRIEVCGIARYDKRHNWPEIHPVIRWSAK